MVSPVSSENTGAMSSVERTWMFAWSTVRFALHSIKWSASDKERTSNAHIWGSFGAQRKKLSESMSRVRLLYWAVHL